MAKKEITDVAKKEVTESAALKVANWLTEKAMGGAGPVSSADALAMEYLINVDYADHDERVDSLIFWETTKNFTSGFITGLGGVITLPVSIPAALSASWLLQARMIGAIAKIYGHSLDDDRVKTMILLTITGNDIKEILKEAGVKIGTKVTYKIIEAIPGKILIEINKKVGFRLLTKAGEKGIVNLTKLVPGVGGLIGGSVDAVSCRTVGKLAKHAFKQK